MTARKQKRPGALARAIACLLSLLLALCLTVCGTVWAAGRVMGDSSLFMQAARRVVDEQEDWLLAKTADIAAEYGFSVDTVRGELTQEALLTFDEAIIEWWGGLWDGTSGTDIPTWEDSALAEAIRADEGFKAVTRASMQKIIAREYAAA